MWLTAYAYLSRVCWDVVQVCSRPVDQLVGGYLQTPVWIHTSFVGDSGVFLTTRPRPLPL